MKKTIHKLYKKIIPFIGLFLFIHINYSAVAATYTAIATGSFDNTTTVWSTNGTTACSCKPSNPLSNNDNIIIKTGISVTRTGNLTTGNSNTITIKGTGTFTITGNFIVNSNSINISVEPGATLNVQGDFIAKNNGVFSVSNSGEFNINGNFTTENNTKPTIAGDVTIGGNTTFGQNTELNLTGSLMTQGTLDVTSFKDLFGTGSIGIGGVFCGNINCISDCATDINTANTNNTGGGSTNTDLTCGNFGLVGADILPVKFTNFSSELHNNTVTLFWTTGQELNNSHFIIEESYDEENFTDKGIVMGAGNSHINQYYSFSLPFNNQTTYYRLKQVDIDGQFDYSKIIVETSQLGKFILYPNPSTQDVICKVAPF